MLKYSSLHTPMLKCKCSVDSPPLEQWKASTQGSSMSMLENALSSLYCQEETLDNAKKLLPLSIMYVEILFKKLWMRTTRMDVRNQYSQVVVKKSLLSQTTWLSEISLSQTPIWSTHRYSTAIICSLERLSLYVRWEVYFPTTVWSLDLPRKSHCSPIRTLSFVYSLLSQTSIEMSCSDVDSSGLMSPKLKHTRIEANMFTATIETGTNKRI